MSLDVWLTLNEDVVLHPTRIYIRENGQTREISREEWEERFPGVEPYTVPEMIDDEVYADNITHNLVPMAEEAGLYRCLWCPEEIGITKARQLINRLQQGLAVLQHNPARFRVLNPANGWGDYDGFVAFVERYLKACQQYPEAEIGVSR